MFAGIQQTGLLNRTATLTDVGDVAAFIASDGARTMTAVVNISFGALLEERCGSAISSAIGFAGGPLSAPAVGREG